MRTPRMRRVILRKVAHLRSGGGISSQADETLERGLSLTTLLSLWKPSRKWCGWSNPPGEARGRFLNPWAWGNCHPEQKWPAWFLLGSHLKSLFSKGPPHNSSHDSVEYSLWEASWRKFKILKRLLRRLGSTSDPHVTLEKVVSWASISLCLKWELSKRWFLRLFQLLKNSLDIKVHYKLMGRMRALEKSCLGSSHCTFAF